MVDSNGNLQVFITATITWLSVPDNLLNNNAQNITDQIDTVTNSIIGAVGALATLGSFIKAYNQPLLSWLVSLDVNNKLTVNTTGFYIHILGIYH
jgi:hypothetical protein